MGYSSNMKPTLSAQMQQSLHLTPQLLQSIRLLQLNGMQLEQEIRQALEHNPLLELDDAPVETGDDSAEDAAQVEVAAFDELPEPAVWDIPASGSSDALDERLQRIAAGESSDLHVRILSELALELPPRQLEIAAFWLEHCDDNGWLDGDYDALLAEAAAQFALASTQVEAARWHLLHGDPAGMAARDLRECLAAQLNVLPRDTPHRRLARALVAEHLEQIAAHDHAAIAAELGIEIAEVAAAVRLIQSLQPRPGEFSTEREGYITPEVVVNYADGQWRVALNPACTPRLSINPLYERALAASVDEQATQALRELMQQARWLTNGLSVRYDTLLRTAREIVAHQVGWFTRGDEAMIPLTLKDIAERIGVHESTISRITTGKYMQTPRGTFELKHFFAVRLDGASVSGAAVKAIIKRLIDAEPAQRPLADEAIAAVLARDGIEIARRTVAKYREQLGIAPARARKGSANTTDKIRSAA